MKTGKIALASLTEDDRTFFPMLYDDADFLFETARNLNDDLSALRELHINSVSCDMTLVMKILAVMTVVALIPMTIGGLLEREPDRQSWPITIFETMFNVILITALTLYAFYRKGWLD